MRRLSLAGLSPVQRSILLTASAANGLFFFDQTSTTVASPEIQRDLLVSQADAQWVISTYLLPLVALMIAAGRLGDLVGRRRLLVVGMLVFGLASLVCALAPSIGVLIAGRVAQGVGVALAISDAHRVRHHVVEIVIGGSDEPARAGGEFLATRICTVPE